jgi:tetratricopeptide (TPR) repeat protein
LPLALGLIAVAIVSLFLVGPGGREQAGARVADSLLGGVGFWDRIHTWTDSVKMVRDYPIFGSGLGSWTTLFPRYQRAPWTEYFVNAAENDYLETAAECGIVGLALLGWLWWKIGRYLTDGSRSIPSRHWPLLAALLAAIVIMAFHESLDFCMQIPANAIMFVLLLGMAIRLVRTHASAIGSRPAKVMDFAAPIVIALAAIAGLVGIRYQREVLYPDDLPHTASIQDNEAVILSHPASPIPHLWLADRVYNSSGVWLTPEVKSAIWLNPNNPAGRDRYVQALLSQGRKAEALQELTTAMYLAPTLNNHSYLGIRLLSWMPKDERAAIERGLREASASGFQGASDGLAQFYLAEGRPFEAANIYATAAQHDKATPREFDYKLAAGVTYAQAGESAQAEKFLLAALHLKRDDPRPYRDLIQMVYGPERDAAAAATIIRMAANNNVSKAPLYSALEDAAQRAGDTGLTETALREAANSDPTFSNWMRLGNFYLEQGNYIRVRNTIRRALQINPQSGEAYFVLAQAEEGTYQYSAARTDYQRAAALSPDHPEFKARSLDLDRKIAEDAPSR